MKKLFVLLISTLFVVSCGEDLEFNTPAFQGNKDGSVWKAEYYEAEINSNGKLVISGGRGSETVVLSVASSGVGTYTLGEDSASKAEFMNTQDVTFSTNNLPDPTVQIYPPDGEIVVEEYNATTNTVSGTFWFNAFTASGFEEVNYSQGVFYQIPVSGGSSATIVSCDEAVAETATAASNYAAADMTDPDYASVCNAYAEALATQIVSCGDDTGVLQTIIDGLDCAIDTTEVDYWPRAISNSWTYNTPTSTEQTYTITSTEMIDGIEYYAFDNLFGAQSWLRKDGTDYYVRSMISGVIPNYQFSATPFAIKMIKEDAVVGETWVSDVSYTVSYTPDAGQPNIPDVDVDATYSFTMIARDLTRTVAGEEYNEVLHISLVVTSGVTTATTDYYYANNIGLIEFITPEGSNALSSYTLN